MSQDGSSSESRPSDVVHLMVAYWGDPSLLTQTVDSALAQDDPHWTLTIVDDCYPDDTVMRRYADHPDARISYVRNPVNLGTAGNFERCRQLVVHRDPGGLVAFVGCDDLLEPAFVGRARGVLAGFPGAFALQPGVTVIDDMGLPVNSLTERVKSWLAPDVTAPTPVAGERLATTLLHGDWLYWPSLVFRTSALRDQTFRADLPIILDLALVLDLVQNDGVLVVDPEPTFRYRRHEGSASSESRYDQRFVDEQRYLNEVSRSLAERGWRTAARAARLRATSRLHALTLLPSAMLGRRWSLVRTLLRHAVGR